MLAERNAALVAPGANVPRIRERLPDSVPLNLFSLSRFHPPFVSRPPSLFLFFFTLLSIVRARARSLARGKKQRRRHQRRSASSLLKCETAKPPAAKQRDTLSRGFPLLVSSSRVVLSPSLSVRPFVRPYVRTPLTSPRSYPRTPFWHPLPPPQHTPGRSGGKTPTRSRAHPSSALATGWSKELERW